MASRKGDRVTGPYRRRDKWRLVIYTNGQDDRPRVQKSYSDWPSERAANAAKARLEERLLNTSRRTVGEAIESYELHLEEKGNKPGAIRDTIWRLGRVFADPDRPLVDIKTEEDGKKLYEDLRAYRKADGEPYAADSHRNMLVEARTFLRWCVGQRWIPANALEKVVGVGRRSKGKPQLYLDEGRAWLKVALVKARREEGATAAIMTALMGMRISEIVSRVARDLDDGGALLWIPDSKTIAGRRTLEVPALLQPLLLKLAKGKARGLYIFGEGTKARTRGWVLRWVKRICVAAGVPPVSAHSMRGFHATIATAAGNTGHDVARALGHRDARTTREHYTRPGTSSAVSLTRLGDLLTGDRRAPRSNGRKVVDQRRRDTR